MKKFLLSGALLAAAVLAGNAQTLSFLDKDGNVIPSGSTYTYVGWDVLPGYGTVENGYANGFVQLKIDPELEVKSTANGSVVVSTTLISGPSYQLCYGTTCIYGTTANPVLTQDRVLEANQAWPLRVEAQPYFTDEPVVIPTYEILVEAWPSTNPAAKITMTLKMGDVQDAAVEGIQADGNAVTVVGKSLNYELNGVNTISVYDLNGKQLINAQVAGAGSLSLAELPAGVYLYKVAGNKGKSGKFIIK